MAINKPSAYGKSVACTLDADALFSSVTGVDLVKQDAFHRLTTDSVLGPGGDGWGYDCRRLLGASAARLASLQPTLVDVLTRDDDRILTADVGLSSVTTRGMSDVLVEVTCVTAEGPFRLVFNVSELTSARIEEQSQ